jgi:hypothetical protein
VRALPLGVPVVEDHDRARLRVAQDEAPREPGPADLRIEGIDGAERRTCNRVSQGLPACARCTCPTRGGTIASAQTPTAHRESRGAAARTPQTTA